MVNAFGSGQEDNPNDTAEIQRGIKYANEVYIQDGTSS